MKVHVHDNNQAPEKQICKAAVELTTEKVLSLHMHPGECTLCPEGHCHWGSIAITLNEHGELYISFEQVSVPNKITLDDYNPVGKPDEEHLASEVVR
jgi:hypothetical protein